MCRGFKSLLRYQIRLDDVLLIDDVNRIGSDVPLQTFWRAIDDRLRIGDVAVAQSIAGHRRTLLAIECLSAYDPVACDCSCCGPRSPPLGIARAFCRTGCQVELVLSRLLLETEASGKRSVPSGHHAGLRIDDTARIDDVSAIHDIDGAARCKASYPERASASKAERARKIRDPVPRQTFCAAARRVFCRTPNRAMALRDRTQTCVIVLRDARGKIIKRLIYYIIIRVN